MPHRILLKIAEYKTEILEQLCFKINQQMAKKEKQEEAQDVAVVETKKKTAKKSTPKAEKENQEETPQKPKRELCRD